LASIFGRGLKFGILAMLLAVPYLVVANICVTALASGGPGWLNLIVLWTCWTALKFLLMGPWSIVLLIRARLTEAAVNRRSRTDTIAATLVRTGTGVAVVG
jgi:hypothetical protein